MFLLGVLSAGPTVTALNVTAINDVLKKINLSFAEAMASYVTV